MNTQRRRSTSPSIGYVYSRRQHVQRRSSLGSTTISSRNDSLCENSWCDDQKCSSCNLLQNELKCLRESTKNALHQSWDEVELLNKKCSQHEEKIGRLNTDLNHSLERECELKLSLTNTKKELSKLKKKLKRGKSDTYLPRAFSDDFLRKALPSMAVSSNSNSMANTPWKVAKPSSRRSSYSGSIGNEKSVIMPDFSDCSYSKRGGSLGGNYSSSPDDDYLTSSTGGSLNHYNDGLSEEDTYDGDRSRHSAMSTFMDIIGLSQHSTSQHKGYPDDQDYDKNLSHHDQLGGEEPQESRNHHDKAYQSGQVMISAEELEALKSKLRRREKDIELLEKEIVQNTKNFQELLLSQQQREKTNM